MIPAAVALGNVWQLLGQVMHQPEDIVRGDIASAVRVKLSVFDDALNDLGKDVQHPNTRRALLRMERWVRKSQEVAGLHGFEENTQALKLLSVFHKVVAKYMNPSGQPLSEEAQAEVTAVGMVALTKSLVPAIIDSPGASAQCPASLPISRFFQVRGYFLAATLVALGSYAVWHSALRPLLRRALHVVYQGCIALPKDAAPGLYDWVLRRLGADKQKKQKKQAASVAETEEPQTAVRNSNRNSTGGTAPEQQFDRGRPCSLEAIRKRLPGAYHSGELRMLMLAMASDGRSPSDGLMMQLKRMTVNQMCSHLKQNAT